MTNTISGSVFDKMWNNSQFSGGISIFSMDFIVLVSSAVQFLVEHLNISVKYSVKSIVKNQDSIENVWDIPHLVEYRS